jgi:chorismate mutase/prephenate dehydratase
VVPVENSTEGVVPLTIDNLINSPLRICGELELRIQLHLLARGEPGKIKRICAHQQALAQCRHWLDANWPGIERVAVASNSEAARLASEQDDVAAVAGQMAAEQYGLNRLAENIEDLSGNTTRFLVIGHEAVPPSGIDKTSVAVLARNKPGALFALLEPLQREGISLTSLGTRPSRTENWNYFFFIEFEGHQSEPKVAAILRELKDQSNMLKVLGSYPKAAV